MCLSAAVRSFGSDFFVTSGGFFLKIFFDQIKKQVTETPWINRRRSERLTTVEGRTVQWNMKKMFLRVAHAGGEDAGGNKI